VTLAFALRQTHLGLEEVLLLFAAIQTNEFLLEAGTCLFPVLSLLNHSCVPNCEVVGPRASSKDLVALSDIRPGEQLLIDYNPQLTGSLSYSQRKELFAQRHFECFCGKCILQK
jgi:SET and MYND domain-containing protein